MSMFGMTPQCPLHGSTPNPRDCWACLQHAQQPSIAGPSTTIDPTLFEPSLFDNMPQSFSGMGLVAPAAPMCLYLEPAADFWAIAAPEPILPIVISTSCVSNAPAPDPQFYEGYYPELLALDEDDIRGRGQPSVYTHQVPACVRVKQPGERHKRAQQSARQRATRELEVSGIPRSRETTQVRPQRKQKTAAPVDESDANSDISVPVSPKVRAPPRRLHRRDLKKIGRKPEAAVSTNSASDTTTQTTMTLDPPRRSIRLTPGRATKMIDLSTPAPPSAKRKRATTVEVDHDTPDPTLRHSSRLIKTTTTSSRKPKPGAIPEDSKRSSSYRESSTEAHTPP